MGRTVAFGAEIQAQFEKMRNEKRVHTGLLVGQRTVGKDLVIYLCPTPLKEGINENEAAEKPLKTKEHLSKVSNSECELDPSHINEAWICQYAVEISRTLPGGFDVLGIYIASSADLMNKVQSLLRQVLFGVFRTLKKDQDLSLHSHIADKILLHICTSSFKCVCRTYNIADHQSTPSPADWKPAIPLTKWHTLQSQMAVDLKFPVRCEDSSVSIKKQIESGLSTLFEQLANSMALVNGCFRNSGDFLLSQLESRKVKQERQSSEQYSTIDLLIPLETDGISFHSETSDCVMMLTFKGTMQCRAFVHHRATVQEAVKAIKQDIIRSIRARCEIHCEDLLVIDEEQQDPLVVYELPKRVFALLPGSTILVSDYQFHGDTTGDSINAFKELLSLEISEDDIQNFELSPATSTLIQSEVNEDRLSEFGDNASSSRNIFLPAAGAAIAAVAAGLSYIFLWNSN